MATDAEKVAEFVELSAPDERLPALFLLASRHYERGDTVLIYAPGGDAAEVDKYFWTCRQNSFIPHAQLAAAEEPVIEPVLIIEGDPGDAEADVLIIADAESPEDWFLRFCHIYDFAPVYDETLRTAARARYTTCQQAGYRMRFSRAATAR